MISSLGTSAGGWLRAKVSGVTFPEQILHVSFDAAEGAVARVNRGLTSGITVVQKSNSSSTYDSGLNGFKVGTSSLRLTNTGTVKGSGTGSYWVLNNFLFTPSNYPTGASFSLWFRVNSYPMPWTTVFMMNDGALNDICVGFNDKQQLFFGNHASNNFNYTTLETNRWYHLVLVLPMSPSTSWRWYLDGRVMSNGTVSHGLKVQNFAGNFTRFYFGVTAPDIYEWQHFDGWIDDFRIFAGQLTAAQVGALFANTQTQL